MTTLNDTHTDSDNDHHHITDNSQTVETTESIEVFQDLKELLRLAYRTYNTEKIAPRPSSKLKRLHDKLSELKLEIILNSSHLNTAMHEEIWDRLLELWLELSKETVHIAPTDR